MSTCTSWHESSTYRAIEFSLLVHSKVKATVHTSDTDESHCHTDEFKDTWYPKEKKKTIRGCFKSTRVTKINKDIQNVVESK